MSGWDAERAAKDALIFAALRAGAYTVDARGVIRSGAGNRRRLKQWASPRGYLSVGLKFNGRKVKAQSHRVVAIAFYGLPSGTATDVNHIDGSRCNNAPENLEWVTSSENANHAFRTGLRTSEHYRGELSSRAKLSGAQVVEILDSARAGEAKEDLAAKYRVHVGTIRKICRGEKWRLVFATWSQGRAAEFPDAPRMGEASAKAKLDADSVRNIHREYLANPAGAPARLARVYGVSRQNIWSIVSGKTWPHIYREFHPALTPELSRAGSAVIGIIET